MSTGAHPKALLAARILDALPQTQCTRCGYPDCAAYAHAIAEEGVAINRCPPGGAEGVQRLSLITGQDPAPLDPTCGEEKPRTVAYIDEDWCIGCTLCIKACPVDAIVGANKRMHTVIEADCTGCELCLPVCPVDCILLENVSGEQTGWSAWTTEAAQRAREQYAWHQIHTQREEEEHARRLEDKARMKLADLPAHSQHTDPAVLEKKRGIIEAALARARQLRKPPS